MRARKSSIRTSASESNACKVPEAVETVLVTETFRAANDRTPASDSTPKARPRSYERLRTIAQ